MTTDTQALIEEARRLATMWSWHKESATFMARLADALEAEMTARRDLTDKIEALARRLKRLAVGGPAHDGYNTALRDCMSELLGLVSGDKKTGGERCSDPACPCQDGDVCHYEDDPITGTKAWPRLSGDSETERTDG